MPGRYGERQGISISKSCLLGVSGLLTIFQEKCSSTFLLAVPSMRVEDVNQNDRKKEHNWCDKADFKATIEDYADTIQTLI